MGAHETESRNIVRDVPHSSCLTRVRAHGKKMSSHFKRAVAYKG